MSVGLMGATGTLDFDGLTVDLVPVGGRRRTNWSSTAASSWAIPARLRWVAEGDARRVFPGNGSSAAVELTRARSRLLTGLAFRSTRFEALDVSVAVQLRGPSRRGGVRASVFLPRRASVSHCPAIGKGTMIFVVGGQQPVARSTKPSVRVPPGAVRAVLQFEKLDSFGSIRIDDVRVTASPNPAAGSWDPLPHRR